MREGKKVTELLRDEGKALKIPEKLLPAQMQKTLEEYGQHPGNTRYFQRNRYRILVSAACAALLAGGLFIFSQGKLHPAPETPAPIEAAKRGREEQKTVTAEETSQEEQELLDLSSQSYGEIYACLSENWKRQETLVKEEQEFGTMDGISEAALADTAGVMRKQQDLAERVGRTNTQVEEIDEADQIKNDGRYLYQIARRQEDGTYGIQILDTEGGLTETAFLDGFESLEEFYVWEDLLITVENKYYDYAVSRAVTEEKRSVEDVAFCGMLSRDQGYHEICIYEISDRSRPKKQKTFTLQGSYESSRIADGYFYGISRFSASPGEGVQDLRAYIPTIDGKQMEADRIYCPPEADGTSYLVLVAVDLSKPDTLSDSRAVVAGSGTYYMSLHNLYIARYQSVYETEPERSGAVQDRTRILRFSYGNGRFHARAEGEVPGRVENSFSMDEYRGNLRMAVTVQEHQAKEIIDDRTGERLGYDYGEMMQTNALYILSPMLTIRGKIEGLAEDETIRSARFLGDTGYFVTFRQTDPLFAVDLSDPEDPRILGELKVSGFSEYLHFYGEELLFGLGMEADEETGQEQGIKLSMFDLTDPAAVKEVSRFRLKDYSYSEALWDHRAVLIDPAENIIGFGAEGGDRDTYFLFSYQEGEFVRELKIEAGSGEDRFCRTRGTFIGDTFYLLRENGNVRAYDRKTGALLQEIRANE